MRKIAIVGFKGGIGKTTISVNVGAGLALRGERVLLVDSDTQANVAIALGKTDHKYSLADILMKRAAVEECIINARENLDLIPGSLSLFKAQQRMVLQMAREEIFEDIFADLKSYDYQIFDCAPSLSLLTVNTLYYVDEAFIPVSMEMLAVSGARQLMDYLLEINQTLNQNVNIRLLIPSFYDPRRKVSKTVLEMLNSDFSVKVSAPIWVDTKLSEAPGSGKTIYEFAPYSRGAKDYAALTELIAHLPPVNGSKPKMQRARQPKLKHTPRTIIPV